MRKTIKRIGKRGLTVLLSAILVAGVFPVAPVSAVDSITLTVTPSVAKVQVGEEVNFTVSMSSAEETNLFSFGMDISIPTGLTFKSESGAIESNFKTATGFADASFQEAPRLNVSGGLNEAIYNGGPLDIATFTCTANASGSQTVTLINVELYNPSVSEITNIVVPAQITVTEDVSAQITLTEDNVTYDGSAKSLTATPEDFSDDGSYAYSYVGTGATVYAETSAAPANAGTYRVTATYTGTYAFGARTAALTITPKALTGATLDTITKAYDGTNAATVSVTELTGLEAADSGVTATVTGVYGDPYVSAGKTVALSDWTLQGAGAGNYSVSSLPASVSNGIITTAVQTVNGASAKNLVINGSLDLSAGISASGGGTLSYSIFGREDAADAELSGATLTAGDATGTVTIQVDAAAVNINGAGDDECAAATPVTFVVNVLDKELVDDTITFNGGSFTYDGTPKALPAAASTDGSGGSFIYSYAGADGTTYGPAAEAPVNAGAYDVTVTYESAAAIGSKTARLTIGKRSPADSDLSFTLPGTIPYDASAHAVTVSAKGGLTGFGAVGAVSYNGLSSAPVNAGTYAVTVAVSEGENYSAASAVALGSFTISPKALANSMLAVTGTPYIYNGSAQSPTYTVTDGSPLSSDDYTVTALPSETNAGGYTLTISGKRNYTGTASQSFTIGKLTPAAGNLSFDLSPVTYDGSPHSVTVTAGAGKTGLGAATVQYGVSENAPADAGNYAITADIAEGTNYGAVTGLSLGSLTVNKAPAVGLDQTLYVSSNTAKDYTVDLTGLLPGDLASAQVSGYSVVSGAGSVVFAGNAEISGTTLTVHMDSAAAADSAAAIEIGFVSNNYDIASAVITVNITDKTPVSISAPAASVKPYDGKALDTDAVAASPEAALEFAWSGTAYDGAIYTDSAEAPVKAGNYVLTARVPDDDAEYIGIAKFGIAIEKAPVVLTADDKSIVVGAALPAYTYSVSGLVSPDTKADVMRGDPVLECPAADAAVEGEYAVTIAGGELNAAAGANYAIAARADGKLTVSVYKSTGTGGSGGVAKPVVPEKETADDEPDADGSGTGAPAWANPFADISASDWFYDDVKFAVENGLFAGTSTATFEPGATMTRAMLVTVLGRFADADTSAYTASDFDDVAAGQYYTAYVEWAKASGIASGTGDNKFSPNAEITRQDLATLLMRCAEFSGKQFPVTLQYVTFSDDALIADYAKSAVEALYCGGIVGGKPGNVFDPKGSATRAEAAAMLHRFAEAVK